MTDKKSYTDDYVKKQFGKNLKHFRRITKLSQMELAVKANVSPNFINDIESGKKWVSAETIGKLANALKVEPYKFFRPDWELNEKEKDNFSLYLDDYTDTLANMVKEFRYNYLPDKQSESKK